MPKCKRNSRCDTEMPVLASWEFDRSKQRENIMKPGVTEVFSDTFGLVRRRDGPVKICKAPSNRAKCTKCKANIDAVQ